MPENCPPFPFLPLFVPGDRPDRFAKAAGSGADAVIIDLEDAVPVEAKARARDALVGAAALLANARVPVFVRINAAGTEWHAADVACLAALAVAGVMLPKAEDAAGVERLAAALPARAELIALVETPQGIAAARALARVASRLAFGSIDFAAALGMAHSREALLSARSELVLASALGRLPAPIDGVTTALDDAAMIADDAAYAASLGFGGKLLIHPRQIAPTLSGFRPPDDEIRWAERVLAAVDDEATDGAVAVDGQMIDAPVRERARRIIERAHRGTDT